MNGASWKMYSEHENYHAENECSVDNGGCDQICSETFESFTCSCKAGYSLTNDGYTCIGKLIHTIIHRYA